MDTYKKKNVTPSINFDCWGINTVPINGNGGELPELLKRHLVNIWDETEEEEPEYLFENNGFGCVERNNIQLVKAQIKTGKSAAGYCFLRSAICGSFGSQIFPKVEDMRVLMVDTEQGKNKVRRRVRKTVGENPKGKDNLFVLDLKGVWYDESFETVVESIQVLHPDLVILDGATDLTEDYIETARNTVIVKKLESLAKEINCAIWCVIHENWKDPNSLSKGKAKGTLGSLLLQKASEIYTVKKNDGISSLIAENMRDYDPAEFPSLSYKITEGGVPEFVASTAEERELDAFLKVVEGYINAEPRKEIARKELFTLMKESQKKSESWVKSKVKSLRDKNLLLTRETRKGRSPVVYYYLPGSKIATEEDLPFERSWK